MQKLSYSASTFHLWLKHKKISSFGEMLGCPINKQKVSVKCWHCPETEQCSLTVWVLGTGWCWVILNSHTTFISRWWGYRRGYVSCFLVKTFCLSEGFHSETLRSDKLRVWNIYWKTAYWRSQFVQTHFYFCVSNQYFLVFIMCLLSCRGTDLVFIFKCLYTCIYRMKFDKAFWFW